MKIWIILLLSLVCLLHLCWSSEPQEPHYKDGKHNSKYHEKTKSNGIDFCRIESCRGCQLDSLPELKNFLRFEVELFKDVEVKYKRGASPVAIFYDADGNELERIDLLKFSQEELRNLFVAKGFQKISIEE
jgi:hypothetical protein